MLQSKFNTEETQAQFESERLINSADLYSEIYREDNDLKELTETAVNELPE